MAVIASAGVMGAAILSPDGPNGDQAENGPLPRYVQRRRPTKEDTGLAADEVLAEFAQYYLKYTSGLWPELVKSGVLPEPTEEIIRQMVEDFKTPHRTGTIPDAALEIYLQHNLVLAAMYPRYSDPNSQPKSIPDQARQILNKVKGQGRFVPWPLVFADYARSATYGVRQGYSSLLSVVKSVPSKVDAIYIDDFHRGSRDEPEWWRFAGMCKNNNLSLVGASDGFDLEGENWEEKLRLYNLFTQMEARFRRQRVRRGMRGAAQRKRVRGKLSLGFTRTPELDKSGNLVRRPDGRPYNVPCFDPETRCYRERIYELFCEKRWSPYKIMQLFNRAKVTEWSGWTEKDIKQLLRNPDAIGVFISNRNSREKNHETGKMETRRNPRSDWDVYHNPKLAIISIETWRKTQRRLVSLKRERASNPGQRSPPPVALFSNTLVCDSCKQPLKLVRSTEKYKQFGCVNQLGRRHGCKLTTSKSSRVIEKCLLEYLKGAIFNKDRLQELVRRANEKLADKAARPRQGVAPLKATLAQEQKSVSKLFDRIDRIDDPDLTAAYEQRISTHQKHIATLHQQVRDLEVSNRQPPSPLDLDRVQVYLADFAALLNQEVPAAAEALRELTGPIVIREEKLPGRKRGARLIATFQPDAVRFLRYLARNQNYPDCVTLEFLCHANWIMSESVEVPVEHVTQYQLLGVKFAELYRGGASVQSIADAHGMPWKQAKEILDFGLTGKRPRWTNNARATDAKNSQAKYRVIQEDVVRLRDIGLCSWPAIKLWLKENRNIDASDNTIRRSYSEYHKDKIHEDVVNGKASKLGRSRRIPPEKIALIHKLLAEGQLKPGEIARQAGVGTSTVRREREAFKEA